MVAPVRSLLATFFKDITFALMQPQRISSILKGTRLFAGCLVDNALNDE